MTPVAHGKARFVLRNAITGPLVDACIAGQPATLNRATDTVGSVEITPGPSQQVNLYIGGSFTSCGAPPQSTFTQGYAPGYTFVLTIGPVPGCSSGCGQSFFVSEQRPPSSEDVPTFCAALVDSDGISTLLQSTFGSITPGTPGTYPTPAVVQSALDSIQATLDAGDATVPRAAHRGLVHRLGPTAEHLRLTNASYDLNVIPLANLQLMVNNINNPNPSPEEAAAKAALTAYYDTTCVDAGAEGTLRFQNQRSSAVDVWVESSTVFTKEGSNVEVNGFFEIQLPGGTHDIRVCTPGSTNKDSAGSSTVANTSVTVADGGNTTTTLDARPTPSSPPRTT